MSETEEFWKGPFGDAYTDRNSGHALVSSKEALFRKALVPMFWERPRLSRIIEFGANRGLNLAALARIDSFSQAEFTAVEINAIALEELARLGVKTVESSMTNPEKPWGDGYNLAISKGVLIHVHPDLLPRAYAALYESSKRWIFIAEYHNPTPVEIEYRGEHGRLWKRDFAKEMLAAYPDLTISDYGFAWSADPHAPLDDLFWCTLEKPQSIERPRAARV